LLRSRSAISLFDQVELDPVAFLWVNGRSMPELTQVHKRVGSTCAF
jgi:hypothetical protein